MNILTFSTLWPNHEQPLHGLFVRERMKIVANRCRLKVMAPVPWFLPVKWFGELYYTYSQVARYEKQDGLEVFHPRYLVLPKIWKVIDGFLMYYSLRHVVRKMRYQFRFDVLDAHWAFPDGYAAGRIASELGVPYTITVRGNDMTVFAQEKWRGEYIRRTLMQAGKVICVARSLQEDVLKLGIPEEKTIVLENGVDPQKFFRINREEARQKLQLSPEAQIILGIGHLSERKGFHLLIDAFEQILNQRERTSQIHLVIVGGPLPWDPSYKDRLLYQIKEKNLSEFVSLVGAKPPEELKYWYSASDLFCLASSREGCPNVILESLACGTPVVATAVSGTPDILSDQNVGILVEQSVENIRQGIMQALEIYWNHETIIAYARKNYSWEIIADRIYDIFKTIRTS
ncbi:MAG: glycosyltransferase [Candidatus Vecturithrix sp.]|jgi:glycosyltransferase involved in cell wall biosynthesis|nr:glycosyltransferase [Candidatus Vecturithrix sp.]